MKVEIKRGYYVRAIKCCYTCRYHALGYDNGNIYCMEHREYVDYLGYCGSYTRNKDGSKQGAMKVDITEYIRLSDRVYVIEGVSECWGQECRCRRRQLS